MPPLYGWSGVRSKCSASGGETGRAGAVTFRLVAGTPGVRSLLLASIAVLSFVAPALAQPSPLGPTREVRALDSGLVTVTTTWRESEGQRSARVTASLLGGSEVALHDGATVRTAIAAAGDTLLVVAYHGGPRAFARAVLAHVREGALVTGPSVELARDLAAGRASLRPASAVVASTPEGFTVLLQEQDTRDPSADVVTTMTRIARDGSMIEAPRQVAIPWALGALAWDGRGYHLAVLWGGWGTEHAGSARVCLVTLSPAGAPEQHPWWASEFDALSDVQLVQRAGGGAMLVVWRRGDGRRIAMHASTAVAGWSVEPPPAIDVARIAPNAPFVVVPDGEGVRVATP